jgi:hypothetical protein
MAFHNSIIVRVAFGGKGLRHPQLVDALEKFAFCEVPNATVFAAWKIKNEMV